MEKLKILGKSFFYTIIFFIVFMFFLDAGEVNDTGLLIVMCTFCIIFTLFICTLRIVKSLENK